MDSTGDVKSCCAAFYGSEYARFLLGDSFHPGGVGLTAELARRIGLSPDAHVLDVAAGTGTSALYLAEHFGCRVTGIDLSAANCELAQKTAAARGLQLRTQFLVADAESLPFSSQTFSAIVCECAFCTFPDKTTAAAEFYRVLQTGGRVGLTDLTKAGDTSPELAGLLAWIACIGDAQSTSSYVAWLQSAGFAVDGPLDRSQCLVEMVEQVRGRMLLADLMVGLNKMTLPHVDLSQGKAFLAAAKDALARGALGYTLLTASKSG